MSRAHEGSDEIQICCLDLGKIQSDHESVLLPAQYAVRHGCRRPNTITEAASDRQSKNNLAPGLQAQIYGGNHRYAVRTQVIGPYRELIAVRQHQLRKSSKHLAVGLTTLWQMTVPTRALMQYAHIAELATVRCSIAFRCRSSRRPALPRLQPYSARHAMPSGFACSQIDFHQIASGALCRMGRTVAAS